MTNAYDFVVIGTGTAASWTEAPFAGASPHFKVPQTSP